MLKKERFIADVKLTKKSKIYGFYARKFSERTEFIINKEKENEFYNTQNTVEIAADANSKTKEEVVASIMDTGWDSWGRGASFSHGKGAQPELLG